MFYVDREEMHRVIEQVERTWNNRALLHAMVDLGRITSFECQVERCIRPSREIDMFAETTMKTRPKDALQFDHIVARIDGGNDRIENIRLSHYSCNVARASYKKDRSDLSSAKSAETRRQQNEAVVTCDDPNCGKQCMGVMGLRVHLRQSSCNGTEPKIECPRCGRTFKSFLRKGQHTSRACNMQVRLTQDER